MQEFNEDIKVNNNVTAIGNVSAASITLNGQDILRAVANALWPVGSIYMSVNAANPSTQFGGTWVAWGTGRVAVGVDMSQTEFNAVEKTGGEKTHILTVPELAAHSHPINTGAYGVVTDGQTIQRGYNEGTAGILSNAINDTGGNQPHNILQPYITCYMWKRTA